MDINKIITESIQSVIEEGKNMGEATAEDLRKIQLSKGAVAEDLQLGAKEAAAASAKKVADKVIHGEVPEELQANAETKKMVAKRLLNQGKEAVEEHPGIAAGTAAAIAAGLGALALRKKIAALAKKGGAEAKKKVAKAARKLADKLE